MSGTDIGPGDFVECVAGASEGVHTDGLVVGKVYRVAAMIPIRRGCGFCGGRGGEIGLIVDTDRCHSDGWCVRRFVPIYRPRAELIAELLAPAPEVV